ncbi:MAG: tetratricopeptide repeat protein [Treponema sp.]|nr:tetratricopeptide repeat protein [Treponema sp.]
MKKLITILAAALLVFGVVSCASTKEIPENLTAAQLFQGGQDAYSDGNYKQAEAYYNKILDMYGDNIDTYIEAKYELGHLYVKTKDYKKAFDTLTEVLSLYEADITGTLPASFKKLSTIELQKIPEPKLTALIQESQK